MKLTERRLQKIVREEIFKEAQSDFVKSIVDELRNIDLRVDTDVSVGIFRVVGDSASFTAKKAEDGKVVGSIYHKEWDKVNYAEYTGSYIDVAVGISKAVR